MRAQLYSYIRGRRLHSVQQLKKYIHICYAVLFYRIHKDSTYQSNPGCSIDLVRGIAFVTYYDCAEQRTSDHAKFHRAHQQLKSESRPSASTLLLSIHHHDFALAEVCSTPIISLCNTRSPHLRTASSL
jgi:hypothetical protein